MILGGHPLLQQPAGGGTTPSETHLLVYKAESNLCALASMHLLWPHDLPSSSHPVNATWQVWPAVLSTTGVAPRPAAAHQLVVLARAAHRTCRIRQRPVALRYELDWRLLPRCNLAAVCRGADDVARP